MGKYCHNHSHNRSVCKNLEFLNVKSDGTYGNHLNFSGLKRGCGHKGTCLRVRTKRFSLMELQVVSGSLHILQIVR